MPKKIRSMRINKENEEDERTRGELSPVDRNNFLRMDSLEIRELLLPELIKEEDVEEPSRKAFRKEIKRRREYFRDVLLREFVANQAELLALLKQKEEDL